MILCFRKNGGSIVRGIFDDHGLVLSQVSPEQRVPTQSPLLTIREWMGEVLRDLDRDCPCDMRRQGARRSRQNRCGAHGGCLRSTACGLNGNEWRCWTLICCRWVSLKCAGHAVWDLTAFTKNREQVQDGDRGNRGPMNSSLWAALRTLEICAVFAGGMGRALPGH
jgi:hypothetical protein